jgi:molybdopterin converting factor small subunit
MKIKLSRDFQDFTNQQETIEVKGSTVKECLNSLIGLFPGLKDLLFDAGNALSVVLVLNGEAIISKDLDRPVSEQNELSILPLIYGG